MKGFIKKLSISNTHCFNTFNIESTCSYICSYQDINLLILKAPEQRKKMH